MLSSIRKNSCNIIACLIPLCLLMASAYSLASDLDSTHYDIYYGDIDSDGDQDIYFNGKELFVLLHGDIATPIIVPAEQSFALYQESGTYGAPQATTLSKSVIDTLTPATENSDFYIADFNGDGNDDVLLRGKSNTDPAVIVKGQSGSTLATLLVVYDNANALVHHDLSDRTNALSVIDLNKDGKVDIRIDNAAGNVAYLTDSDGIPSEYSSVEETIAWEIKGGESFYDSNVNTDYLPGATQSNAGVSSGGAFTYSVPIQVPPGTRGIEPKLSLNYSSNAGDGILGVGWKLGGMSSIKRCPATYAQDGIVDGVDFDDNDKYCLNGKRLIAISGAPGGDGTEYRTEIDSFTKVESNIVAGELKFKAWQKDGRVLEFGYTNDSLIEVSNTGTGVARFWALNKLSDRSGNYLTVTYEENSAQGSYRPTRIDYTGNTHASTSTFASVEFFYDPAPNAKTGFFAGHVVSTPKRLNSIATYVKKDGADVLVKQYNIAYDATNDFPKSRVVSIQECAISNQCLTPLKFDWKQGAGSIFSSQSQMFSFETSSLKKRYTGDYNGDGRLDILWSTGDVWFGKTDGSFDRVDGTFNNAPRRFGLFSQYRVGGQGDFNGDGKTDILTYTHDESAYPADPDVVLLSNGDGSFDVVASGTSTTTPKALTIGEFDGDGLTDFYSASEYLSNGDPTFGDNVWLSQGDGTFVKQHTGNPQLIHIANGDFNGDGLTDVLMRKWDDSSAYIRMAIGGGQFETTKILTTDSSSIDIDSVHTRLGHFNNDRLIDIFSSDYVQNGNKKTYLNNGDGTFTVVDSGISQFYFDARLGAGSDFNGDGLTDFYDYKRKRFTKPFGEEEQVFLSDGDVNDHVYLSQGDGTFVQRNLGVTEGITGASYYAHTPIAQGDFNGDGISEFLWCSFDGNEGAGFYSGRCNFNKAAQRWTLSNNHQNQINTITDSLGNVTQITYRPISDTSVYTGNISTTHPEVSTGSSMYVVANTSESDGIGGTRTVEYHYGGAVRHKQGRGFQGFESRTTKDTTTGISVTEHYATSFPYTGMKTSAEIRLLDNTLIQQTTFQHKVLETHAGTGVQFPYYWKVDNASYELDGSGVLSKSVTKTYDSQGRLTFDTTTVLNANDATDSLTTDVSTVYQADDTANWIIHKAKELTQTKTLADNSSATREDHYQYNTKGLLNKHTQEPDSSTLKVDTSLEYDSYGNINKTTIDGIDTNPRITLAEYRDDGRFIYKESSEGLSNYYFWDVRFGELTSTKDTNDLLTTHTVDDFGQTIADSLPDGTQSTYTYDWCSSATCPAGGVFKTNQYTSGLPQMAIVNDSHGRVIRSVSVSFEGKAVYEDTQFNAQGKVTRESQPYFDSDTPQWNQYEYDLLGRVTKQTSPDTTFAITEYEPLLTRGISYDNHITEHKLNVQGLLASAKNAKNQIVEYDYDPFGNVLKVRADVKTVEIEGEPTKIASATTVNTYDIRGNQLTMVDPDTGSLRYQYNALGEITTQTDAKQQSATFNYDDLGRLTSRVQTEGTSTWQYDSSGNGTDGLLIKTTGVAGEAKEYTYDEVSRLKNFKTTIDGSGYLFSYTYDNLGRLDTTTYPTGFTTQNQFNHFGGLEKVINNSTGEAYWQGQSSNAYGDFTQFITIRLAILPTKVILVAIYIINKIMPAFTP
jgi:YD repeat-containing protein